MRRSNLYFIADQARRYVKIGLSQNPERRLHSIQAGSPIALRIDHVEMNVECAKEIDLHQNFAGCWLHREWFLYRSEIAALVDALKRGEPALEKIPPAPVPKGYRTDDGWLTTREDTMRYLRDGYGGSLA